MSVTRIASRYAKSLLDLAVEQKKLDKVLEDIKVFQEYLKNRDLYLMFKSPIVNITKKQAVVKALFEGKLDTLVLSFFGIILRKNREMYLPEIAEEFINQYKVMNEITTATLVTATEMSAESIEKIRKALLESDVTAKKLELHTEINPDLLGGFVIKIGDKLYDASISHKLDQLKKQFASKELA